MKHATKLSPEALAALQKRDKNRLIMMTVGAVVLAIGYFAARAQQKRLAGETAHDLPTLEAPTEAVFVPEFDMPEVLDAVKDARPDERVVLEPTALNAVFDYGRLLTERHYEAIHVESLTPDVYAELIANPAEYRVKPFRARGEIVALTKRKRAENRPEEHAGTMRLDDGTYAHFIVLTLGKGASEVGDFVRVDGMFLKLYSVEGEDGWMEGPLLCGAETVPSFPAHDPAQGPIGSLEDVEDDTLGNVTGLPFDAKWELLRRARDEAGAVDWAAAPKVDGSMIAELFANPEEYRGKPFRVDISQNMDGGVEVAGENPLRLERITTGWIANQNWVGQVPYLYYLAPFDRPELGDRYGVAKLLKAEGFFFKNMSYTTAVGDLRRVPVFVMSSVEPYVVPPDETSQIIMWSVLVATIVIAFLLWVLLARDKKKSSQLHEDLVRRRRARREKLA